MKLSAGSPFGSILGVRRPLSCPAQLGQWDKDQDRQVDPGLALVPVPSRARDWKNSRLELSQVREAESGAASEGRRRGQSGLASAKGAEPAAKFTKRREDARVVGTSSSRTHSRGDAETRFAVCLARSGTPSEMGSTTASGVGARRPQPPQAQRRRLVSSAARPSDSGCSGPVACRKAAGHVRVSPLTPADGAPALQLPASGLEPSCSRSPEPLHGESEAPASAPDAGQRSAELRPRVGSRGLLRFLARRSSQSLRSHSERQGVSLGQPFPTPGAQNKPKDGRLGYRGRVVIKKRKNQKQHQKGRVITLQLLQKYN
ncbi:hypothetical protein J1605_017034 [Eschrichtius robustus]|uniref:Uncharacterized protein n=1 Tax=Eschrichtius robustus TaxID=9764 RepID=A0AB34I045_ESCRO|nr:hypothetical protein J1605_017034 [Eschrichtius robustus]